jgi:hypothetical protein
VVVPFTEFGWHFVLDAEGRDEDQPLDAGTPVASDVLTERGLARRSIGGLLHVLVEEGDDLFRMTSEIIVGVLEASCGALDPKQLLVLAAEQVEGLPAPAPPALSRAGLHLTLLSHFRGPAQLTPDDDEADETALHETLIRTAGGKVGPSGDCARLLHLRPPFRSAQ